jgi:hypothetical protein
VILVLKVLRKRRETAQRGSTTGQIRFNSTLGVAEVYNGSEFIGIDKTPELNSISPSTSLASGTTITVTGSNFSTTGTTLIKLIGADGSELSGTNVNVSNDTTLTFQTPSLTVANEPYDVKIIKPSGLAVTLTDVLDAGSTPSFSTSAGSIGTMTNSQRSTPSVFASVQATDTDGQSVTHTISAGTFIAGLTLNSNGTISGTATAVSSDTTYTFTVSATDGTNTATRQFTAIVKKPLEVTYDVIAGGGGNAVDQGGNREAGSGAGGWLEGTFDATAGTQYNITVGGGGSGRNQGSSSQISGSGLTTIQSTGGGSGGNRDGVAGTNGGSGGGGWYTSGYGTGISGQGHDGSPADGWSGGGGGGKGSAGSTNSSQGVGGNGYTSSIQGGTYCYGGDADRYAGHNADSSAGANTGSGGSGAGNGGSGRVHIKLLTSNYSSQSGGSVSTSGDYTIIQYTGNGTFVTAS